MSALISLIVPIYNVESFLCKCIESIIQQTYNDIEIILINDGSSDNCGKIIDKYASIDNRIVAIHNKNQGVSAARNQGLEISSGKYIMFVDGDDYVEPEYVEYFIRLIQDSNCEMAVNTTHIINDNLIDLEDSISIVDSTKIIENIYLEKTGVGVVNKIYKKSVIDKHNLRFDSNFWYAEGMLFNIMYLQYVSKVAIGRKPLYHTVTNPNSATRKFNLESQFSGLRSMEFQRDHWLKSNKNIQMAWEYHYRRYAEEILIGLIKSGLEDENKKIFDKCVNALKKNLRIPLQVNVGSWIKTRSLCIAIDPEITLGNNSFKNQKTLRKKFKYCLIYIIDRSPERFKEVLFNKLKKHFNAHYRPYYLSRSLL